MTCVFGVLTCKYKLIWLYVFNRCLSGRWTFTSLSFPPNIGQNIAPFILKMNPNHIQCPCWKRKIPPAWCWHHQVFLWICFSFSRCSISFLPLNLCRSIQFWAHLITAPLLHVYWACRKHLLICAHIRFLENHNQDYIVDDFLLATDP